MRSFVLLAACLSAVALTSCRDDEVCNPGLELKDGVCVPIVETTGGDMTPDAGANTPPDASMPDAGAARADDASDAAAPDGSAD